MSIIVFTFMGSNLKFIIMSVALWVCVGILVYVKYILIGKSKKV